MAKGRPRAFDAAKALDTALHLFWEHGYEGTSISMLADAMNIKIPSLYSAFGNKEELFLKAVQRYGELNGCMYHDSLKKKTAYEVVESILMGEVELVTRKTTPDGCLMLTSALATSPDSERIRKFISDMRAMPEKWIAERLKQAQKDGDLPKSADPAALAFYIMTVNWGIAAQAKSGATRAELTTLVKHVLKHWPN